MLSHIFGFTAREKWTFIAVAFLFMAIAMRMPPAHESVVEGKVVREAVLFGYIIPKWLFMGVGAPFFGLTWWGFWLLYGRIWPEKKKIPTPETIEYEKSYPMAGGGAVYWKPDVPGASSPMDYEPPQFTDETTAIEFLTVPRPNPMRGLIVGDDWNREDAEFRQLKENWLANAPERTLKDLIPAAERIFAGQKALNMTKVAYDLVDANQARGIPTTDELHALANRVSHEEIASILRDSQ